MNWFITSILYADGNRHAETHRTFGYYSEEAKAIAAVEKNMGNMHECLYNFLVIEKFNEGVMALADDKELWYRWDMTTNGWVSCEKPSFSIGTVNWAIG